MLRTGQTARLLARLQSVADAIDGCHSQSVISDALRLAARRFATQGTLTQGWVCSGRRTCNGGGHRTSHLDALFSLPVRSFASGGDVSGPDTRAYAQAMAEWNRMQAEEADQGAEEGEVMDDSQQIDQDGKASAADSSEEGGSDDDAGDTEDDEDQAMFNLLWESDNLSDMDVQGALSLVDSGALDNFNSGSTDKDQKEDQQLLEDAQAFIADQAPDEPEPPDFNSAGPDRPGWRVYGLDEENAQMIMGLDFTGGRVPDNEKNALLSQEAKNYMFWMHNQYPEKCTPKFLGRLFRVREQRVLAILALKTIEFQEDWDRAEEEAQEMRALQQQCIEAGSFKPAGIDLELDEEIAAGLKEASEALREPEESREDFSPSKMPPLWDYVELLEKALMFQSAEARESGTVTSGADSDTAAAPDSSGAAVELAAAEGESAASQGPSEGHSPATDTPDGAAAEGAIAAAAETEVAEEKANGEGATAEGENDAETAADYVDGAGLLEPGDQRLEEYWAERYDTNEVPGINYRELQDLELHEVADFTRDMHPLDVGEAVRDVVENDIFSCVEAQGTFERHIKIPVSYPEFKEGPDGRLVHSGPSFEQLELAAQAQAEQEEARMVHQFTSNLLWNMRQTGVDIRRESRIKHPPRRPEGGWDLLVKEIGGRREGKQKVYVAQSSGEKRQLNTSEIDMLKREKPLRYRKNKPTAKK